MSCVVRCEQCKRTAHARVIGDDWSTNAFECEPDWEDDPDTHTEAELACPHDDYIVVDNGDYYM